MRVTIHEEKFSPCNEHFTRRSSLPVMNACKDWRLLSLRISPEFLSTPISQRPIPVA